MVLIVPPPPFVPTRLFDRLGAAEDITAKFLKDNYLTGLTFVDEAGNEYPDTWYEQKIAVAFSNLEHYTNMTVLPRTITDEMHDYYIRDYQMYAFIQLYQYPVIVTQTTPSVAAIYPTGQTVTTFPREWVRTDAVHGQIQLIPTQGSLSQVILGQGGSYLPIIYQGLGYLPQLFHVDYIAGFEEGKVPQLLLDAVSKLACIELLSVIGDSVLPTGVSSQSIGVDGLSESRSFMQNGQMAPVFSGRIAQYKRELFGDPAMNKAGLFDELKNFYKGINMFVTA